MRNSRPVIQILAIAFSTLVLSFLGMFILLGEVRQEILRMISASIALPQIMSIPPVVWRALLALSVAAMLYLIARGIASLAIPPLRNAHSCPKCDGHIQRVHRQKPERWLSILLRVHIGRYNCINCEWSGLRRYHKHRGE